MRKSELIAALQALPADEDYEVVVGHEGYKEWHGVVAARPAIAVITLGREGASYCDPYRTYVRMGDGHQVLPIVFLELSLYRTTKEQ